MQHEEPQIDRAIISLEKLFLHTTVDGNGESRESLIGKKGLLTMATHILRGAQVYAENINDKKGIEQLRVFAPEKWLGKEHTIANDLKNIYTLLAGYPFPTIGENHYDAIGFLCELHEISSDENIIEIFSTCKLVAPKQIETLTRNTSETASNIMELGRPDDGFDPHNINPNGEPASDLFAFLKET